MAWHPLLLLGRALHHPPALDTVLPGSTHRAQHGAGTPNTASHKDQRRAAEPNNYSKSPPAGAPWPAPPPPMASTSCIGGTRRRGESSEAGADSAPYILRASRRLSGDSKGRSVKRHQR
ncbi:hypothetical protein B0H17DRAFT_1153028 [Mycena rosella]|uniref:Uncharacterized protein n=1 Tax=Mycena rosella TaxID=1033263 RepID=A0AAD7FBL4_MYCRO|nr:hypothetical protein B0H17DRAFT_1153028 [Mycena rosella]